MVVSAMKANSASSSRRLFCRGDCNVDRDMIVSIKVYSVRGMSSAHTLSDAAQVQPAVQPAPAVPSSTPYPAHLQRRAGEQEAPGCAQLPQLLAPLASLA